MLDDVTIFLKSKFMSLFTDFQLAIAGIWEICEINKNKNTFWEYSPEKKFENLWAVTPSQVYSSFVECNKSVHQGL